MDFVWITHILLLLSSRVWSQAEVNKCPAGHHKDPNCPSTNFSVHNCCKKCRTGTYLETENTNHECLRCLSCEVNQRVITQCDFNQNRICACKEGYYYKDSMCRQCTTAKNHSDEEFKNKCLQSENPIITKTPSYLTTTLKTTAAPTEAGTDSALPTHVKIFSTSSGYTANNPPILNLEESPWFLLIIVVLGAILILLLLNIRNRCIFWRIRKDLESPHQDQMSNEQCIHQDNDPPLVLNICEKIPMMSFCQNQPVLNINSNQTDQESGCLPAIVLYAIIKAVPLRRWKEFLRLLSVADQQMERVEMEAYLGLLEKQYQMLRLWSQRPSANLNDVYSSLHNMDLSGCAQLLQERLQRLEWGPEDEQRYVP